MENQAGNSLSGGLFWYHAVSLHYQIAVRSFCCCLLHSPTLCKSRRYRPQVLCPWCHGPAVRAGSHLDLWSAAHSQRDHPHCLSVHHHQRLPGNVHLHLPLRPVQKGNISVGPLYFLHLFIQHSSCDYSWTASSAVFMTTECKCFANKHHDG